METKERIRHGDLLLTKIGNVLPDGAKPAKDNILALGETTGHAHRLNAKRIVQFVGTKGEQLVQIEEPTELSHEEHRTVTIGPGAWLVTREREYDPFAEEIRKVMESGVFKETHKSRKGVLLESGKLIAGRTVKLAKYSCPSTGKEYVSFVPDAIETIEEALAWKFGLTKDEYLGEITQEG